MNHKRALSVALIFGLALIAGCGGGSGSSDASNLQGTWKITKMGTGGSYLPADRVNTDGILVLEGDAYIRKQGDKIQNEWTFTADATTSPAQLKVSRGVSGGKERFSYLIYKIEGDTLTTKSGSRDFPTDFSLTTDSGCYVTVYQRQ